MSYINIILDKSTFQSLSYGELMQLTKYFKHNITPILTQEVLGDLKKEFKENKAPSEQRVIDFANKLFPNENVINMHYQDLLIGSLLGEEIIPDGRPTVKINKSVSTNEGKNGWLLEETDEERAIFKWKSGNFTEVDYELSEIWRSVTNQQDIVTNFKKILAASNPKKFTSISELNAYVSSLINEREFQQHALTYIFERFKILPSRRIQIYSRLQKYNFPLLKNICPYVYHCLRVDYLFMYALTSDLISTKPTNTIDLEYLYYLPFCNVFSSNDKVHKKLAPLLINSEQNFIIGNDLKEDLKKINETLQSMSVEDRIKYKSDPPIIDDSITFKLWKYYYGYPKNNIGNQVISGEEFEKMKKQIDNFIEATEGDNINLNLPEDVDFIVKKSYLSMTDPCYCGSGKNVIDCCIPKEKFIELSKNKK